jgi:hypothetical protein
MAVGVADLDEAIHALWSDNDLDDFFTDLWPVADVATYPVLQEDEATPGQPFPYCVLGQRTVNVKTRMSDGVRSKRESRLVLLQFRVFAKEVTGDSRSAKKIAADLAAEIMKIWGGHPTTTPQSMELSNGTVPLCQYDSDYGVLADDDKYTWHINYKVLTDVPVKT